MLKEAIDDSVHGSRWVQQLRSEKFSLANLESVHCLSWPLGGQCGSGGEERWG